MRQCLALFQSQGRSVPITGDNMATRKKVAKKTVKKKTLRSCSTCGKPGHNARTCPNAKRRAKPKPPLNMAGAVSRRWSSKEQNLSNPPRPSSAEPAPEASDPPVLVVDTTSSPVEELLEPSDIEAKGEADEALEEADDAAEDEAQPSE